MNKLFTLIFSILTIIVSAQESQKGLLWKITGNGTTKPSYIYGNMHVSSKIAFRLGEEFFEAISSTDKIALESNPIIWLDEIMQSDLAANYIGRFSIERNIYIGFYKKSFKISIPDNEDFASAIMRDHYFMNWLLYRENKSMSDFEEETFLDMFIYQAGAKNGKEVISLENFKQTTYYAEMASIPDKEEKEPSKWYKNLTKEKRYGELMEEAYRKQDLSLIDSLQKETSSDNSLYWMIYKRNEIMAHNIDSIIRSGTSLFSGVGAAHLPGEKGILNLLKKMGYTLTPMPVTFSDKARKMREEFDDKKLPLTDYKDYQWELFSVKSPVKIYETPYSSSQRHFFGPGLTNGTHYTIKQISTYAALEGLSQEEYYQKIDSLLFENIPGKIESKKEITGGSFYKGFDILNKTKNGDYQRFRIYISPVNVFIFKMGGKDDYVKDYGDKFFESIKLKTPEDREWKTVSTIHHDFTVDVPDYYSINFNQKVTSLYGQPVLDAFDISDSSYYLLKRQSLYDWNFIEEDNFELKRIAEQFFLKQHLDTVKAIILNDQPYPAAVAYGYNKDSSAYVAVKVVINGPYFYLMCAVTKDKKENNRFFDSFKINDIKYKFEFKEKHDSANFFTVKSNYLSPRDIEYIRDKAYYERRHKNDTKDTEFKRKKNSNVYYGENYERIKVNTKKFHIYTHYDNIDSLWNEEIKTITTGKNDDYYNYFGSRSSAESSLPSLIVKEKKKSRENGLDVLYLTVTDTASSRAYLLKYILKRGMLYRIQAETDTSGYQSEYVKRFFDSFKPMDTLLGRPVFEDKASLFFNSIYGTDSLAKERALQSVSKIDFKKKDIDSLKLTIETYSFPAKYIEVKRTLINELIGIKDYDPVDYVSQLYKESGDTAMYQMEILKSLAWRGDKKSIKAYLDLLDYDIPISGGSRANGYIFYPFRFDVKKHKEKTTVFPELLNYTFIAKYRGAIIGTLARQVDSAYINPSVYKKNVNQILREAKIVMKEEISYEQSEQADDGNSYRYGSSNKYKYKNNNLLVNYAIILIPHHKNKKVQEFLDKFYKLNNYTIRNEVFCRMEKQGIRIDTAVWGELARDPVNVSVLYEAMQDNKILDKFPMQYINQQLMAQSLLFQSNINFDEDSIMFLEKRFVNDGKDSGYVYFFKTKEKGDDDWELNYCGYQPKDTTKVSLDTEVEETGEYIDKALDIKEIIDEQVNIIKLRNHPHADGSEDRGGYGFFF
jgi:uncharacterized protein YbaP (TraB family)